MGFVTRWTVSVSFVLSSYLSDNPFFPFLDLLSFSRQFHQRVSVVWGQLGSIPPEVSGSYPCIDVGSVRLNLGRAMTQFSCELA